MTPEDVKQKVHLIHATKDTALCEQYIKEMTDDGWKVGLFAFRKQVTQTSSRRPRPLKTPRWQWRFVGNWYKGDDLVWYYNNRASNKAHAIDFTTRHPLPLRFHAKILEGVSDPKLYFMPPAS